MISLQPLLSDPLLLLTLLLVRASKEVDVVLFLLLSRCRCSLSRCSLGRCRFATLKLTNASLQREDKRLQVISDFLELLVLHLEGIELLHKSHVFAAAGSRHQAVHLTPRQLFIVSSLGIIAGSLVGPVRFEDRHGENLSGFDLRKLHGKGTGRGWRTA